MSALFQEVTLDQVGTVLATEKAQAAIQSANCMASRTMQVLEMRVTYSFMTIHESGSERSKDTRQFNIITAKEMLRSPRKFDEKALEHARRHFDGIHPTLVKTGYAVFPSTLKIENVVLVAVTELPIDSQDH
jgi:hypothetical protein